MHSLHQDTYESPPARILFLAQSAMGTLPLLHFYCRKQQTPDPSSWPNPVRINNQHLPSIEPTPPWFYPLPLTVVVVVVAPALHHLNHCLSSLLLPRARKAEMRRQEKTNRTRFRLTINDYIINITQLGDLAVDSVFNALQEYSPTLGDPI